MRGSATGMLRQRDRALIALVAIARYLSTAQAQRLGWPAKDASVARKRLHALAGLPFKERRPDAARQRQVVAPPSPPPSLPRSNGQPRSDHTVPKPTPSMPQSLDSGWP